MELTKEESEFLFELALSVPKYVAGTGIWAETSEKPLADSLPGFHLGIQAADPIEIDKIQAIMAMTGAQFEQWERDQEPEFMIYFVPAKAG